MLRHVLNKMEGHFISGYADGKNTLDAPISLKQDAITSAQSFLDSHPETKHHFDEVTKLVNGFESPYTTCKL